MGTRGGIANLAVGMGIADGKRKLNISAIAVIDNVIACRRVWARHKRMKGLKVLAQTALTLVLAGGWVLG